MNIDVTDERFDCENAFDVHGDIAPPLLSARYDERAEFFALLTGRELQAESEPNKAYMCAKKAYNNYRRSKKELKRKQGTKEKARLHVRSVKRRAQNAREATAKWQRKVADQQLKAAAKVAEKVANRQLKAAAKVAD